MFIQSQPADPVVHEKAMRIASETLYIIRCLLREEEWGDFLRETYMIARRILEEKP